MVMSSSITQCFRKSDLPRRFGTRQILYPQPPKFALGNSKTVKPMLFQSSFSRTFTNVKDPKTEHGNASVIMEGSKVPEKELVITSFGELV